MLKSKKLFTMHLLMRWVGGVVYLGNRRLSLIFLVVLLFVNMQYDSEWITGIPFFF